MYSQLLITDTLVPRPLSFIEGVSFIEEFCSELLYNHTFVPHPFLIISGCDHNDHVHCPLFKDKIVQNSSIRTWTSVRYRELREYPLFRCFNSTQSIVNSVGASSSVRYNIDVRN